MTEMDTRRKLLNAFAWSLQRNYVLGREPSDALYLLFSQEGGADSRQRPRNTGRNDSHAPWHSPVAAGQWQPLIRSVLGLVCSDS